MKILIVGSKGFIGHNLFDFFTSNSLHVWGADVAVDYGKDNYILVDPSNADFNVILKPTSLMVALIARVPQMSQRLFSNPKRDYYLNTKLVFDVLEAIRQEAPHCKFIQLSSAAVYGAPQILPISEEFELKPISPYGWHKYQSELLCREYSEVYKLTTIIVRIFSVYGPGLKKQFFWDLFQKCKTSKSVELFGTGNESRDFIHIDDLVSAILLLVENNNLKSEVFNLASGIETTIKQASQFCNERLNENHLISFNNIVRKGDPLNWKADITKISKIGFRTLISIEKGIENYIAWAKGLEGK